MTSRDKISLRKLTASYGKFMSRYVADIHHDHFKLLRTLSPNSKVSVHVRGSGL